MTADRCAYFKMKNQLKKEIYHQADTFTQMLEKIGLRETKNEDFKKLAYKYTAINRTDNQYINVLHSIHSIGLQRSDYIQIDNMLIFDMHKNPSRIHVKDSDEYLK